MHIRYGDYIVSSLSILTNLILLSSPNSSSSQELFDHSVTLSASAERSSFGLLSDNESGLGASIGVHYDLSTFLSIFSRFGYGMVGRDYGVIHFDNSKDAYIEIFDIPLEIGGSFYLARESLRPYVSLARTFHHMKATLYSADYGGHVRQSGEPRWDYSSSFSESMGLEVTLNSDLLLDFGVTQHWTENLDYFLLRAGIRYVLLR